jgi:hypothetical protein
MKRLPLRKKLQQIIKLDTISEVKAMLIACMIANSYRRRVK